MHGWRRSLHICPVRLHSEGDQRLPSFPSSAPAPTRVLLSGALAAIRQEVEAIRRGSKDTRWDGAKGLQLSANMEPLGEGARPLFQNNHRHSKKKNSPTRRIPSAWGIYRVWQLSLFYNYWRDPEPLQSSLLHIISETHGLFILECFFKSLMCS